LQCGIAGAIAADACRINGILGLLGSSLLGKRELHLGRDGSNEGIQRPSILVVVDVTVPNCFPHVPHLEPYPHHRDPLDVVGLGEGRPPTVGTDILDNGLDPAVSMVPVRDLRRPSRRRVRACLDCRRHRGHSRRVPQPGAPPTRPCPSRLSPPHPWLCAAAHCAACSRTASLASLSSSSVPMSAETELLVLLSRRASSSAAVARAASAAAAAYTSALAAASSAIVTLATLPAVAAISITARSCSSAAATSASFRCCALEATER
jgi:hypothetical protein